MSQYYQHWKELFDALTLRERAIISVSILAIIILGWDAGLMQQLNIKKDSSAVQIQKLTQKIQDIDQKTHDIAARLQSTSGSEGQKRLGELKFKLTALDEKQKKLAVQFIRPRQMVQVLKGMLAQEKGLKLTRLESASVKPLFKPLSETTGNSVATMEIDEMASLYKEGKAKTAMTVPHADYLDAETLEKAKLEAKKRPQIFKHGLEIELQGDYLSTLSYLKSLEKLPWRFYWDGVNYKVIKHPKANITINIYTLSLDKGWIGV